MIKLISAFKQPSILSYMTKSMMLLFLYLSFQVKQNYSRRALLRLNRKTCQRPVSYNERKKVCLRYYFEHCVEPSETNGRHFVEQCRAIFRVEPAYIRTHYAIYYCDTSFQVCYHILRLSCVFVNLSVMWCVCNWLEHFTSKGNRLLYFGYYNIS